jgi:hypothetical protein
VTDAGPAVNLLQVFSLHVDHGTLIHFQERDVSDRLCDMSRKAC